MDHNFVVLFEYVELALLYLVTKTYTTNYKLITHKFMDFLTKEWVRTFSYTTINKNREGFKEVVINGRKWFKHGLYQSVTLVGILYRVYDPSVKSFKMVLHVGTAVQHPSDIVISRPLAYETAETNALMNPQWTMEVGENFDKYSWYAMAEAYVNAMDLKFIKTAKELQAEKNGKKACVIWCDNDDLQKCNGECDNCEHIHSKSLKNSLNYAFTW